MRELNLKETTCVSAGARGDAAAVLGLLTLGTILGIVIVADALTSPYYYIYDPYYYDPYYYDYYDDYVVYY